MTAIVAESASNPLFPAGLDQALGNMEGKEVRFGAAGGGLWAAVTTGTSTGAVNAMHDSLTPIGGLVPMFLMMLGEITPGGVGAGHVRDARVRAADRVHRRPDGRAHAGVPGQEDRGLRDEDGHDRGPGPVREHPRLHGASPSRPRQGQAGPLNAGPHGFSEILYAFASQTGNNGSAFAGLTGNTPFYNITGALAMLIGRFAMIIPILAIAGSLAAKRRVAPSPGTFPTTGPIFVGLLIGVVVIVGALNFFPALSLGPIVEQLLLAAGQAFQP